MPSLKWDTQGRRRVTHGQNTSRGPGRVPVCQAGSGDNGSYVLGGAGIHPCAPEGKDTGHRPAPWTPGLRSGPDPRARGCAGSRASAPPGCPALRDAALPGDRARGAVGHLSPWFRVSSARAHGRKDSGE